MEIKLDSLSIKLDTYKRNICIVSRNERETENLLKGIRGKWEENGGLFYFYDKSVKLVLANREKYSDGKSQVPLLVVCQDKLDMSWIFKIQEKSQVNVICIEECEIDNPNFYHQIKHEFDRYWSINGTSYKVPITHEVGASVS